MALTVAFFLLQAVIVSQGMYYVVLLICVRHSLSTCNTKCMGIDLMYIDTCMVQHSNQVFSSSYFVMITEMSLIAQYSFQSWVVDRI